MTGTTARIGRPSSEDLARRAAREREAAARLLLRALQHLNYPSRLSDSPLCQLEGIRRQAAALRGYRYPRARVVIDAVRRAHMAACAELADTEDGCCLVALGDAIEGGVARRVGAPGRRERDRDLAPAARGGGHHHRLRAHLAARLPDRRRRRGARSGAAVSAAMCAASPLRDTGRSAGGVGRNPSRRAALQVGVPTPSPRPPTARV